MEGRHSSPSHAAPSGKKRSVSAPESNSRRSAPSSRTRTAEPERAVRRSYEPEETEYTDFYEAYETRAESSRNRQPMEEPRSRRPVQREEPDERTVTRRTLDPVPARRKKKKVSVGKDILIIFLMTAVILLVFAYFHHVKDRIDARKQAGTTEQTVEVSAAPIVTPTPTPAQPEESPELPPEETQEPEVIDNRTEWQKKFEDKFTDEVVITDNSYSSPNISVTIETVSREVNGHPQTWYVADVYVASIDCMRTYFAQNNYIPGGCLDEAVEKMCAATNAIFAVSGDYCSNQKNGFLIRNGEVIHDEYVEADICVLFLDGTVETFSPGEYEPADLIARGAWQSWKFGPALLDKTGHVPEEYNSTKEIMTENAPRCGFGYYEPGHYCLVVNDGRQSPYSYGLMTREFSAVFEELGCTRAYNFDGGATSVMAFNGQKYSKPYGNRNPGDIFLLAEPAAAQMEENG